jgi:hypothetical protein
MILSYAPNGACLHTRMLESSYARKETRTLMTRLCVLNNVAPLRNVETVQELSDILVAYAAGLLDVGGALGDVLDAVSGELKLVLDVLGGLDVDTRPHVDPSDDLLANEVSDLNLPAVGLLVLLKVDVDREMGVDVSHLVLEALGDTDDQVVLSQSALVSHVLALTRGWRRRTMIVRTVRRVATLLREPWWSSILMRFCLGCAVLVHVLILCDCPTHVCEGDSQVTQRLGEFALVS